MTTDRIYTAALCVIGDEILSGRTQDKNISQIALWLNLQGIRLREVRVVPDVEDAIVEAVNQLRARNDYLFTTGGIGPTHDDITVDAIAKALGVGVVHHPEASAMLHKYYENRGGATEARMRMARVPDGADLIPKSHVWRAGHPPRQHFHHGGRAQHHRRDARCVDRHVGRWCAAPV
jgi:molybdenum cofactor synthesis domain-containing protein